MMVYGNNRLTYRSKMAGSLVLNFFYCIIFMAFMIPDAAFGQDIRVFKDEKYIFVNFDYTDMLVFN